MMKRRLFDKIPRFRLITETGAVSRDEPELGSDASVNLSPDSTTEQDKLGTDSGSGTEPSPDVAEGDLGRQAHSLMSSDGILNHGSYKIGEAPDKLTEHGIISCNCLFVYDADAKVGAVAHINFYRLDYDKHFMNSVKKALNGMINEIVRAGADESKLQFIIVRHTGVRTELTSEANMRILEEAIQKLKRSSKSAFIETDTVTLELESGKILDGERRLVERFESESVVSPDDDSGNRASPAILVTGAISLWIYLILLPFVILNDAILGLINNRKYYQATLNKHPVLDKVLTFIENKGLVSSQYLPTFIAKHLPELAVKLIDYVLNINVGEEDYPREDTFVSRAFTRTSNSWNFSLSTFVLTRVSMLSASLEFVSVFLSTFLTSSLTVTIKSLTAISRRVIRSVLEATISLIDLIPFLTDTISSPKTWNSLRSWSINVPTSVPENVSLLRLDFRFITKHMIRPQKLGVKLKVMFLSGMALAALMSGQSVSQVELASFGALGLLIGVARVMLSPHTDRSEGDSESKKSSRKPQGYWTVERATNLLLSEELSQEVKDPTSGYQLGRAGYSRAVNVLVKESGSWREAVKKIFGIEKPRKSPKQPRWKEKYSGRKAWEEVRAILPDFVKTKGGLVDTPDPRKILDRDLNAKEIRALKKLINKGNGPARLALIMPHKGLVCSVAKKIIRGNKSLGLDEEELIDIGMWGYTTPKGDIMGGLARAAELFKPSDIRKAKFSTYAGRAIDLALWRFVNKREKEKAISLNKRKGAEDERTLEDLISVSDLRNDVEVVKREDLKKLLCDLIGAKEGSKAERNIEFLVSESVDGLTQVEIAEKYNIKTRASVSIAIKTIKKKVIKALKKLELSEGLTIDTIELLDIALARRAEKRRNNSISLNSIPKSFLLLLGAGAVLAAMLLFSQPTGDVFTAGIIGPTLVVLLAGLWLLFASGKSEAGEDKGSPIVDAGGVGTADERRKSDEAELMQIGETSGILWYRIEGSIGLQYVGTKGYVVAHQLERYSEKTNYAFAYANKDISDQVFCEAAEDKMIVAEGEANDTVIGVSGLLPCYAIGFKGISKDGKSLYGIAHLDNRKKERLELMKRYLVEQYNLDSIEMVIGYREDYESEVEEIVEVLNEGEFSADLIAKVPRKKITEEGPNPANPYPYDDMTHYSMGWSEMCATATGCTVFNYNALNQRATHERAVKVTPAINKEVFLWSKPIPVPGPGTVTHEPGSDASADVSPDSLLVPPLNAIIPMYDIVNDDVALAYNDILEAAKAAEISRFASIELGLLMSAENRDMHILLMGGLLNICIWDMARACLGIWTGRANLDVWMAEPSDAQSLWITLPLHAIEHASRLERKFGPVSRSIKNEFPITFEIDDTVKDPGCVFLRNSKNPNAWFFDIPDEITVIVYLDGKETFRREGSSGRQFVLNFVTKFEEISSLFESHEIESQEGQTLPDDINSGERDGSDLGDNIPKSFLLLIGTGVALATLMLSQPTGDVLTAGIIGPWLGIPLMGLLALFAVGKSEAEEGDYKSNPTFEEVTQCIRDGLKNVDQSRVTVRIEEITNDDDRLFWDAYTFAVTVLKKKTDADEEPHSFITFRISSCLPWAIISLVPYDFPPRRSYMVDIIAHRHPFQLLPLRITVNSTAEFVNRLTQSIKFISETSEANPFNVIMGIAGMNGIEGESFSQLELEQRPPGMNLSTNSNGEEGGIGENRGSVAGDVAPQRTIELAADVPKDAGREKIEAQKDEESEEAFTCRNCNAEVSPLKTTQRNHCPHCLWSIHLDDEKPGDRASKCNGLMRPMGVEFNSKKGWIIVFQCQKCGEIKKHKSAPDDNFSEIIRLSEPIRGSKKRKVRLISSSDMQILPPPTHYAGTTDNSDAKRRAEKLAKEGVLTGSEVSLLHTPATPGQWVGMSREELKYVAQLIAIAQRKLEPPRSLRGKTVVLIIPDSLKLYFLVKELANDIAALSYEHPEIINVLHRRFGTLQFAEPPKVILRGPQAAEYLLSQAAYQALDIVTSYRERREFMAEAVLSPLAPSLLQPLGRYLAKGVPLIGETGFRLNREKIDFLCSVCTDLDEMLTCINAGEADPDEIKKRIGLLQLLYTSNRPFLSRYLEDPDNFLKIPKKAQLEFAISLLQKSVFAFHHNDLDGFRENQRRREEWLDMLEQYPETRELVPWLRKFQASFMSSLFDVPVQIVHDELPRRNLASVYEKMEKFPQLIEALNRRFPKHGFAGQIQSILQNGPDYLTRKFARSQLRLEDSGLNEEEETLLPEAPVSNVVSSLIPTPDGQRPLALPEPEGDKGSVAGDVAPRIVAELSDGRTPEKPFPHWSGSDAEKLEDFVNQKEVADKYDEWSKRLVDASKALQPGEKRSIALYAGAMLNNAILYKDFDKSLETLRDNHVFNGGTIFLYARNEEENDKAKGLKAHMKSILGDEAEVEIINLEEDEDDENTRNYYIENPLQELDWVARQMQQKGAKNILGIIRENGLKWDKLFADYSLDAAANIPIIIINNSINGGDHGLYSFAGAIALAVETKNNAGKDGWVTYLQPIGVISQEMYDEYRIYVEKILTQA
ncbi:MAG: RNHCP domain-containing protein [Candidatus Omnitrophica bacterium]|nr:RNHCP domain-containing protein [Candidatus Omnitrophota bacterium]